jgi:tagatose 1,6-diphosphate aldolase
VLPRVVLLSLLSVHRLLVLTAAMPCRFVDPGVLVDRELELVSPDDRLVDSLISTLHHPVTRSVAPELCGPDRQQIVKFVRDYPLGRVPGDPAKDFVPYYAFWMRLRAQFNPPVEVAGTINLRIGNNQNCEMYIGHIGYNVYPPARGNHYAERAVRLVLPLARHHGFDCVIITCNPDNVASRRTCERLGATLIETIDLPKDHPLYQRGERQKCRYRLEI